MTTKKRTTTPPDVAVLKAMVQEQTLKIAALEDKMAGIEKSKASADESASAARKELAAAQAIIDNAHDLIDACPAALPRVKKVKPYTWSDETREQPIDLLVRMGSWLGATNGGVR